MKTLYKKTFKKLVVVAMIATIIPIGAFAKQTKIQNNGNNNAGFCSKIENFFSKADENFIQKQIKLSQNRLEKINDLNQKYADRDQKKEQNRGGWDQKRDKNFQNLLSKAKTDAQKQAVEKFISAMNNAVTLRRQAVDAAISVFRQGIKQAIETRKLTVDQALKTFNDSKKIILEKAKTDCASGVDQKIVRQQTTESLKTAKQKLQDDIKAIEKTGETVSALAMEKKGALDKALEDFNSTVEAAKQELKAAFE